MKPGDKLHAWKAETAIERVIGCRIMLAGHGFMSDAEKRKIDARIDKWAKKHGYTALGEDVQRRRR